ncbi:MAG: hypothetical protein A2Y25_00620 [Candidatus Melainabacteria bacterium GWF2_37_15]|nr:MAG: hypothetical protein A2Y25_00620 [Candidatus Melainabacteria bacterium GWF2_37_15]
MKILYCTDFSNAALHSFEKALPFLKDGCEADIISVSDLDYAHIPIYKDYKLQNLESARSYVESKGIKVIRTLSPLGNPAEEIIKRTLEERYDLIVIGSRSNVLYKWIGSTSRKVAEKSSVPVFIARMTQRVKPSQGKKDVLFAVDGSENSYNSITKAVEILDFTNSSVEILTVKQGKEDLPIEITTDKEWLQRILDKQEENARQIIEQSTRLTAEKGIKVDSGIIQEGDTANEIMEYAEAKQKDLIIMGSHGREGVSSVLLGSISKRVLDNTFCPVMIVPTKKV